MTGPGPHEDHDFLEGAVTVGQGGGERLGEAVLDMAAEGEEPCAHLVRG